MSEDATYFIISIRSYQTTKHHIQENVSSKNLLHNDSTFQKFSNSTSGARKSKKPNKKILYTEFSADPLTILTEVYEKAAYITHHYNVIL
jgi:hypothetical protein